MQGFRGHVKLRDSTATLDYLRRALKPDFGLTALYGPLLDAAIEKIRERESIGALPIGAGNLSKGVKA